MRVRIQAVAPLPARQYYYPALRNDQDTIEVLTRRIATELLQVTAEQVGLYIDGFELPAHVLVSSLLRDNDLIIVRRRELDTKNDGTPSTSSSESESSSSSGDISEEDEDIPPVKKTVMLSKRFPVVETASSDSSSSEESSTSGDSSSEDDSCSSNDEGEDEEMDVSPLSQVVNKSKRNNGKTKQKTPSQLPKPLIKPRPPPTPGKLKPVSPPPPPDEAPVPLIYDAMPVGHHTTSPQLQFDNSEPPSTGKNLSVVSEAVSAAVPSTHRNVKREVVGASTNKQQQQQANNDTARVNGRANSMQKLAPPLSLAGSKRKTLNEMLQKPPSHIRFDGYDHAEDNHDDDMNVSQDTQSEASSVKPKMLFTRIDLYDGMVYDSPNNRKVGTPIAAPLAAMNPTPVQTGKSKPTSFTASSMASAVKELDTINSNSNDINLVNGQSSKKRPNKNDDDNHDSNTESVMKRTRRRRRNKSKSLKQSSDVDVTATQNAAPSSARDESMEDLLGDHEGTNETKMEIEDLGNYSQEANVEEVVTMSDEAYAELMEAWRQRRRKGTDGGEGTPVFQERKGAAEEFENHLQEMWNTVANPQQSNNSNKILEKAVQNKEDIFGKSSPIPWLNLPLPNVAKNTPTTVIPPSRINKKSLLNPSRLATASPTPSISNEHTSNSVRIVDRRNSSVSNTVHAKNRDSRPSATPHQAAYADTTISMSARTKDYSAYPTMSFPNEGDIIAYKVLQMINYQPVMSDYREARIMEYESHRQVLTLRPIRVDDQTANENVAADPPSNKFDLPPDEEYVVQDYSVEVRDGEDYKIRMTDLCDARIVFC
ncbi:hypothetical protein SeMB42_g03939 [Synchytrium endobioticum]|uniref:Coilin tudor domain-containing protein n=1 Tax=Synchytrium endobioticum TaxID=286115 RepID=A0A507D6F5_9FUNG|nr:hypothetical protein SeMB42_g03939 [Synchytrium endobioticum]TPX46877.1 hypothetical protein SeLEV6574_g02964 [Synchytrium endobioticum]